MHEIRQLIARLRVLADLMQQSIQAITITVLLSGFIANPSAAANGDEQLIVSPIIQEPSGEIHHGELVWVDLLTTDTHKAAAFYTTVFGWQSKFYADDTYAELSSDGRVMSSIVLYDDDEAVEGDARWLVSISVKDVDEAVQRTVDNGGEVLEAATDLPNRGRYAVIADSQDAVLMLLRATGGDPKDAAQYLDEWAWAELWTDDSEAAVDFYAAIVGYDTWRLDNASGDEQIVLGTDGRARATVVPLPWDDVKSNWVPYIPVGNATDTLQRIVDAGGAVLVKSGGAENSVSVAIVMDPTGGVFAIQQAEINQ